MDIRNNIKRATKNHNTTLEAVAKRMGINKITLYRNIAGNITIESLQKIASSVPCDISEFFTSEESPLYCPYCGKPIYLHPSTEESQQKPNK